MAPDLQETLSAGGVRRGANTWPGSEWWKAWGDPGLDALIEQALRGNPDLKIAAQRVREAEATARFRAAALMPVLNAQASVTGQRLGNIINEALRGNTFAEVIISPLVLSYHLDLWGRDRAALEGALGVARARAAELAQARVLLSAAVAKTYVRLAAASQRLALAGAMRKTLSESLKLSEVRLAAGLDSQLPRVQAQRRLKAAEQREKGIEAEIALLRDQLAALAGRGPDFGRQIRARGGGVPLPPAIPADLPLRLLSHRPDIVAARELAVAAAKDIKVAKTAFYPDVNLAALAGLDSVVLPERLFALSSGAFAVGPVLQLPIFQGGRLEARYQAAQASYAAAVETYNKAVLRAAQEVADSLAQWRAASSLIEVQRQAIAAGQEAERLAQVNENTGLSQYAPVLEARYQLAEEQYRLTDLQALQRQTAVQLAEALGGGYSGDSRLMH